MNISKTIVSGGAATREIGQSTCLSQRWNEYPRYLCQLSVCFFHVFFMFTVFLLDISYVCIYSFLSQRFFLFNADIRNPQYLRILPGAPR